MCVYTQNKDAEKFRRKKTPLGWEVFSPEMREKINKGIEDIEKILLNKGLSVTPLLDYRKEL